MSEQSGGSGGRTPPNRSAETWQRVQDLFQRALDLPTGTVDEFLDRECHGDAEIRREVLSLLQHDHGEERLNSLFGVAALTLFEEESLMGERVGAYQITGTLGHGGMGTVYRAVRADDEYRKQVAIKVVKRGMDTRAMLERFRQERQILANLDHPNIARLIDGGSTAGHRPFLVMEYVDGQPIDVYCRDHNLGFADQCRLFLQVGDAVAYAHRNLVVHRDLKPRNILVTSDGTPKLLDFGLAKLLSPDLTSAATLTQIGLRPLTPDYASPEQFQGNPATTAADVYSLGAVLYELLTGVRAHQFASDHPSEWTKVVCEREVRRPEDVRPDLPTDLANILLMALRKEPERRYSSVEQFAGDIRRYLEGRPVLARGEDFGYRAGKFIRRHRVWLAAGVLAGASLIGGSVMALLSARDAHASLALAEREQREIRAARTLAEDRLQEANTARTLSEQEHRTAENQRQLAVKEAARARQEEQRSAQRLTQLLELANHSLFDVHNTLAKLPGGTTARQEIVQATLTYLEKLSKDAAEDDRLRETLARAYFRIGNIQGSPNSASLGDTPGALKSFRLAEQWIHPLMTRRPVPRSALELEVDLAGALGALLAANGQVEAALKIYLDHLHRAAELARVDPTDGRQANLEAKLSSVYSGKNPQEAVTYGNKAIEHFSALAARQPGNSEVSWGLSGAHSILGSVLSHHGDGAGALGHYTASLRIREELCARHPENLEFQRSLILAYGQMSDTISRTDSGAAYNPRLAYTYLAQAAGIARRLSEADPRNRIAKYDLAAVEFRVASLRPSPATDAERVAHFQHSIQLFTELIAGDPKALRYQAQLSLACLRMGRYLREMNRPVEALAAFRQGLETANRYLIAEPQNTWILEQAVTDEEAIAELLALSGDRLGAREHARHVMERTQAAQFSQESQRRQDLAEACHSAAVVEKTLGDWVAAHRLAEQSVAHWRSAIASAANRTFSEELKSAEALVAECNQHLR